MPPELVKQKQMLEFVSQRGPGIYLNMHGYIATFRKELRILGVKKETHR